MTTDLSNTLNKRRPHLRNALWYGGFWLLLTFWLRLALPESMMGWERHQLFHFSADYPMYFATRPYPILLYIQAFFTQFYLYPLLGAAVMGGLLVSGMGAWHRLTCRMWPGAVWVAFMLPTLPYLNLLWVLVWLVLLGGGLLISLRGLSTSGRLGVTAACGLLGTLVIQENIVLALIFWSLICGLRERSWRNGLYGFAATAIGVALGLGAVRLGYPFFYLGDLSQWSLLRFHLFVILPFPASYFVLPPLIQILTYISLPILICLPLTTLCPKLSRTFNLKSLTIRTSILMQSMLALLLTGLLITAAYLNLRYQNEDFYLVDRLGIEGRWHEAAEAAEFAFFERVRPEAAGTQRAVFLKGSRHHTLTTAGCLGIRPTLFQDDIEEGYMANILKICLLADQQATNKLFAYNGSYYFPLLFPEDILQMPSTYLMAQYYTQNGLYAEALHILYDLVTMNHISTAVLTPLLWNNVVVGDYEPCRKFIRFFEQSLFHKDIARRYTAYLADTAQIARQPDIMAARTQLSTHNHTVLAYLPDDNTHFRLRNEPDNATVYEYALALWLVYKNHDRILEELPKIRQYYPILPLHIQEAVLANFLPETLDEAPADLHPGIKARYRAFQQAYGLYQNGYLSFKKLRKSFEDTYWYHALFNEIKPLSEIKTTRSGQI
ncbi:MAG: hypothetical protein K2K51_02665 [Bacteroidales bacterium]|nr:hypothetical protein [Bacteroidales bacterium]